MFHLSQNDGRCNMNSASSSLKSFSVTCASRAAFVADSCEERWFSVLPAEPHTNPPDHLLWHAELLLNQRAVSGAEKHIQFTALISLTQSIIRPSSHPGGRSAFFSFSYLGTFQMGVWVWVSIRHAIWRRLPRSRKLPGGFMCFSTELPLSRLH